eukprot:CAMPEP_0197400564 /NCGR_PEP_ID=MMETSP1165-20131217/17089_1 /TAXON_ID=284809 /ORGANISM="Chrysocystis fragilis, Strain CCMP3189" /LENGTH=208 /DNA_ID=CAMNT_0042926635 /DNA_START=1 /DNA_END=628 /DNA_ORIENTATION=-
MGGHADDAAASWRCTGGVVRGRGEGAAEDRGEPPGRERLGCGDVADPKSSWPEGLGGLPVVAIDPGDSDVDALVTAPHSTVAIGDPVSVLEPPFSSDRAVAELTTGSCVIVDGAEPEVWRETTLPLVKVLAAAAVDRARLLVSLFDPLQLNSCCEALVLGSLDGASVARLGLDSPQESTLDSDFSAGCGIAIPPDPRLWSLAITYNGG